MKLKSLTVASIITALINPMVFADQANRGFLSKEIDPLAASAYWTPEKLKNAKPFESEVNQNSIIKQLNPDELKFKSYTMTGEDGMPPSVEITPELQPLYKSGNIELTHSMPTDSGGSNDQFSSSRLVPVSADLSYPYRTVGKLFFTTPKGNFVCSASVIKPRIVLTAGHCVHAGSGDSAGFYSNFLFVPAFRDGSKPYASWDTTYVNVTSTWATGGGNVPNAADYAMLEMKDQTISGAVRRIGDITGFLGYKLQSLLPNHLHLLGYPCNFDSCSKMHQITAQSAEAVSPNNVVYGSDMKGGSSGGPWVQNFGQAASGQTGGNNPGMNRVVGVTSWDYKDDSLMAEGASIFDNRFTELLDTLCNHQSGNC